MNADFGHGLTRKEVQSELKYLNLDARCFSSAGSGQALSEAKDINYSRAGCLASLNITSGIEYGKGTLHFSYYLKTFPKKHHSKKKRSEKNS